MEVLYIDVIIGPYFLLIPTKKIKQAKTFDRTPSLFIPPLLLSLENNVGWPEKSKDQGQGSLLCTVVPGLVQ